MRARNDLFTGSEDQSDASLIQAIELLIFPSCLQFHAGEFMDEVGGKHVIANGEIGQRSLTLCAPESIATSPMLSVSIRLVSPIDSGVKARLLIDEFVNYVGHDAARGVIVYFQLCVQATQEAAGFRAPVWVRHCPLNLFSRSHVIHALE